MEKSKKYRLWYSSPAPMGNENLSSLDNENRLDDGWEKWSLPIGNGFLGGCIFGRTDTERVQITENSLCNPMFPESCGGGLNNLAELYLDFGHETVSDYVRELDIENAVACVEYKCSDVTYRREYFASYPDKVICVGCFSDKPKALNFSVSAISPYLGDYCVTPGDGCGKKCKTTICDDMLILSGEMFYYGIKFELRIKVRTNGKVTVVGQTLKIQDADFAEIILAAGTNYKMESSVFLEKDHYKKLSGFPHPSNEGKKTLNNALEKGYNALKLCHIQDYKDIYGEASVDFDGIDLNLPTDELLETYKAETSRYLEELFFNYGRYLLIASSRQGGLPANLQGIWNRYNDSPWTAGYWHNINIQMNYWLSFNTGLSDCFIPYYDYFKSYLSSAREKADDYIKEYFPENFGGDYKNGWTIGTGAWPYEIQGLSINDHSGPGTGAFTALLFWDYYDYTGDKALLKQICYPALYEAALFFSKIMVFENGCWLIKYSASPEQWQNGKTIRTTGCAFDQQMADTLFRYTVKAAEILGESDSLIETLKERIPLLEPFIIGDSGQIKEYRDEKQYGELGEYNHRHISHLLGVYPGDASLLTNEKLNKAVQKTLELRGDRSTGWAMALKLCVWARTGNGEYSYNLLKELLKNGVLPNLWDTHPPFQIDGNFGAVAGITEMLMQSHETAIRLLPALPDDWKNGSFKCLTARGGFNISANWENCKLKSLTVFSISGNDFNLYTDTENIKIVNKAYNPEYSFSKGILTLLTINSEEYTISFERGEQ